MEVWTYIGDTVTIDVTVTDDGVAADLSDAAGTLILNSSTPQEVECTIAENIVTATFDAPDEAGDFDYQMRIVSDVFTRTIADGVLHIKPSLFTTEEAPS